jgi:predicted ATP-grasp superfamily ATP-dependent carboligase
LIFPVGDAELLTLSAARDELDTYLPYADHAAVLTAFDKLESSKRAKAVGLHVPAVAASTEELSDLEFPVVVKERLHGAGESDFSIPPQPVVVAGSPEAAAAQMSEISRSGGRALAQTFIGGDLLAVICLLGPKGERLAVMQQRALRTFPPGAGVSTRARTERVDDELADKVVALLRDIGWFGLAELQFVAPPGGDPHLIDLNGRFYGSLALAVAAGADVASTWSEAAAGGEPETVEAAVGRRYQWLEGDLRRAVTERRGGLIADVLSCLFFAAGARHSIWDLRDPLPGILYGSRLAARGPAKVASRWI